MVTLRVGVDRVTFDGVRWQGDDLLLVEALEVLSEEPRRVLSPSIPRADVFVAEAVLSNSRTPRLSSVLPRDAGHDAGAVY